LKRVYGGSNSQIERAELDRIRLDLEDRARQVLNCKLEEVSSYLEDQALAREKLERIRNDNEAAIRNDFDRVRRELTVSLNTFI